MLKKLHVSFFIFFFQFLLLDCYGAIVSLQVMIYEDHIIRLAGDLHHAAFAGTPNFEYLMQLERSSSLLMAQELVNFLDRAQKESILTEKVIANLPEITRDISLAFFSNDPAAVSLITRLNILADHHLDTALKLKAMHIGKHQLKFTIQIHTLDLRSKYPHICNLCFPANTAEYEKLYRALYAHRNIFKSDILTFLDTKSQYHSSFIHFIEQHARMLILKMKNPKNLEDFFTYDFPDFGYLDFIARNTDKNITLFLGIAHATSISHYLENIGYKTIFKESVYSMNDLYNNRIPPSLCEDAYKKFFE